MSLRIKEKSTEQILNDYLDTIYLQSHSASSKKTYRTAIVGTKNGFRIFLKEKYNCDEVQLAFRIQNKEFDVYEILSEYVIFLDKKSIKPKTVCASKISTSKISTSKNSSSKISTSKISTSKNSSSKILT